MAKILVIDDERAIRNTLKEILEFEGYTVEVAENGRVGLDMALATKYDLIYTDIKMPEMDGMEFLLSYRATKIAVFTISIIVVGLLLRRNVFGF